MKKNEEFQLVITDLGINGEGIGKYEGMTWFVKDALIGDVIRAKAIKIKKNYGYARMMETIHPSKDRVTPACPVNRQCGGCSLQALSYEKQLLWKHEKVLNNLVRIGGFERSFLESVAEPPAGMENPYRYRNKAQFPIGTDKEGNPVAGFYAARTHVIIPVTDCLLGQEENAKVLQIVLAWMRKQKIAPYEEETGKGLVRHVLIRKGEATGELMVCLIINGKTLPNSESLVQELQDIQGMKSISVNCNEKRTNVILGETTITIWGEPTIRDVLGGVMFEISPQSFYQVNPKQTEILYKKALEYANLTGEETVWDLYCGIGTISLFMAKKAKQVFGVEIVPQAIADAKRNAKNNGIENATFFVGKAEEVYPEYVKSHPVEGKAQVIVVDPPRKGCEEALLAMMCHMSPERIVYVSCDSATLARDLKFLCGNGYALRKLQAVDQFCQTGHVETCALLVKASGSDA